MTFYTPPEVAKLLKVNRDTVLNWIRSGRLPAAIYPGTKRPRYRISQVDLERFHETNRIRPPTPAQAPARPMPSDVTAYY
jgi:excisionase family DNA binding protein